MAEVILRKFEKADWKDFRDIRLEALRKHPAFFSPSRDETQFNERDWIERIENKNAGIFGLYIDHEIVGLTGIVRDKSDRSMAHYVMSYIKANFRGQGLSKLFYDTRKSWAVSEGDIRILTVRHRDDNTPCQRAHQKFGFKFIEATDLTWPDGLTRPSLHYEIEI